MNVDTNYDTIETLKLFSLIVKNPTYKTLDLKWGYSYTEQAKCPEQAKWQRDKDTYAEINENGIILSLDADSGICFYGLHTTLAQKPINSITDIKTDAEDKCSGYSLIAGDGTVFSKGQPIPLDYMFKFEVKGVAPNSTIIFDFWGIDNKPLGESNFKYGIEIKNTSSSYIKDFEFLRANKFYCHSGYVDGILHVGNVSIRTLSSEVSYQELLAYIMQNPHTYCNTLMISDKDFDNDVIWAKVKSNFIAGQNFKAPISFCKRFFNKSTVICGMPFTMDGEISILLDLRPNETITLYFNRVDLNTYKIKTRNDSSKE